MISALAIILLLQLMGEGIARLTSLGVPGPVIGLILFAVLLAGMPQLRTHVEPVATTLLTHLSLLFVPAAVGLIQHLGVFGDALLALVVTLSLSTLITLLVTAFVFVGVSRLTSRGDATTEEA